MLCAPSNRKKKHIGINSKSVSNIASSDSQIDKPLRGRPKRAELPDALNTNTSAQMRHSLIRSTGEGIGAAAWKYRKTTTTTTTTTTTRDIHLALTVVALVAVPLFAFSVVCSVHQTTFFARRQTLALENNNFISIIYKSIEDPVNKYTSRLLRLPTTNFTVA